MLDRDTVSIIIALENLSKGVKELSKSLNAIEAHLQVISESISKLEK